MKVGISAYVIQFQVIFVKGFQTTPEENGCMEITLTPDELKDPNLRAKIESFAKEHFGKLSGNSIEIQTSIDITAGMTTFTSPEIHSESTLDYAQYVPSSTSTDFESVNTAWSTTYETTTLEDMKTPGSSIAEISTELIETTLTTHQTTTDEDMKKSGSSIAEISTELIETTLTTHQTTTDEGFKKLDCFGSSGVTRIYPKTYNEANGTLVYCDNETDGEGWTVFQRRQDGSVNFIRGWDDYVQGFGNLSGNYWMGLEKLHLLTSDGRYELRVDLEDWDGNRAFAKYSYFSIAGSWDNYRLHVTGYSGTAGDSLTYHNNQQFSASDRDNDESGDHCSQRYKGGWWFGNCHTCHLNGVYLEQRDGEVDYAQGIIWKAWKDYYYSLKFAEMKFRRSTA